MKRNAFNYKITLFYCSFLTTKLTSKLLDQLNLHNSSASSWEEKVSNWFSQKLGEKNLNEKCHDSNYYKTIQNLIS